MKRILSYTAATLFLLFLCKDMVLMPRPSADNALYVVGWVDEVREGGGEADIVIKIKDDEAQYYVNRGLESGLTLEDLSSKFKGKQVKLSYVDDWSILDPTNQSRHISSIQVDGRMLYSEFRP